MKKITIAFIWIFLLTAGSAFAQITIAPTNLFIDSQSRFGTYMVINNSNEAQEIEVEFLFEAFALDSEGQRDFIEAGSEEAEQYSIADNLRAFPQNFVLSPGQRQVVRIRVAEPQGLNDGTYWARIKTTSVPQSPPVELGSDENITARVGVTIEQVTGLYYKKGDVSTAIDVQQIRSEIADNTLNVYTDFERGGNSPFLGSITYTLLNNNNEEVATGRTSTTLFFGGTHFQRLDIADLDSGEYTLQVRFETRRNDISQDDIVTMEPETATTTVTIP